MPNTFIARKMLTPGVSIGTKIMLCWLWRSASGLVLPITIAISQFGCRAFDDHHFRPLMTYSSPSRTIEVSILVASDEATRGSVIKKADRIVPSMSGLSHFSCCSGVPYFANTSMLPVSGAPQLKISGDHMILPIISASGAYSKLVRPGLSSP